MKYFVFAALHPSLLVFLFINLPLVPSDFLQEVVHRLAVRKGFMNSFTWGRLSPGENHPSPGPTRLIVRVAGQV